MVATYVIEIPLTFLFFAPTAALKQLTFAAQLALMLLIMATGNYNFFNVLFGSDIFEICINMDSKLPGSSEKRLTGNRGKLTYSPAVGCNWLCRAGV